MVNFNEMQPRYRIPPVLILGLVLDLLQGKQRSFGRDARTCIKSVIPPVRFTGLEAIPNHPCLITINHYTRPGFQAWWLALGVSAALAEDVHWLITAAWTFPGRPWAKLGEKASRWLLKRLAGVYGFTTMPPMPPRPEDLNARAQSVRQLVESVRQGRAGWLGIAPEGRDNPGGILGKPPAGSGRFLLLLANQGLKFLPVGICEEQGALIVRFGAPYRLNLGSDLPTDERDRQASLVAMLRLAELLPEHLQGEYRELLGSERLR